LATTPGWAGTVSRFDPATGLGHVTAVDGTEYPFHCTAVADGSRSIDVGVVVVFDVVAGHRGIWEAGGLVQPG
jgi:cold shock CspA family protein